MTSIRIFKVLNVYWEPKVKFYYTQVAFLRVYNIVFYFDNILRPYFEVTHAYFISCMIHLLGCDLGACVYHRFWAHIVMAYVFTFWTCYVLLKEYEIVESMRLHFIATERRRPDQFTVSSHQLIYMSLYINDQNTSSCVRHIN